MSNTERIFIIIGLIGGISAIVLVLITLIINTFTPLINFIPEANLYIRDFEIFFGLFSLAVLTLLLRFYMLEMLGGGKNENVEC